MVIYALQGRKIDKCCGKPSQIQCVGLRENVEFNLLVSRHWPILWTVMKFPFLQSKFSSPTWDPYNLGISVLLKKYMCRILHLKTFPDKIYYNCQQMLKALQGSAGKWRRPPTWLPSRLDTNIIHLSNSMQKVILDKLIVPEVVKKISAYYRTEIFVSILITPRRFPLSEYKLIHFTFSQIISILSILVLFYQVCYFIQAASTYQFVYEKTTYILFRPICTPNSSSCYV
jgi:hypothetical protein